MSNFSIVFVLLLTFSIFSRFFIVYFLSSFLPLRFFTLSEENTAPALSRNPRPAKNHLVVQFSFLGQSLLQYRLTDKTALFQHPLRSLVEGKDGSPPGDYFFPLSNTSRTLVACRIRVRITSPLPDLMACLNKMMFSMYSSITSRIA